MPNITQKLLSARDELLDLGLRNPLLNYRSLKARGLEVIRENPVEIFRILVREGKKMTFLASPKRGESQPELPEPEEISIEDVSDEEWQARYTDQRLQTAYDPDKLQSRLIATHKAARTFIEEQGVNTLFLALGMLRWRDADSSQDEHRAPLILIPVELERAGAGERFKLSYSGEELVENLSLAAKLKTEFRIALPELPETEDLDLANYFTAVERAMIEQPRWSVDRDAISLNLFSFAKFLMFRDLDEAAWPVECKPSDHPLIGALLDSGFNEPALTITDDDHLDEHIGPQDLRQVVDADSSQVMAMVAVDQGSNLIIQGPPGTGKSQTITNLIADAIGKGKKVLFIAEKMAALEVVKRRLDKIGLGDACLELHSRNTTKRALLGEIGRTLNLGRPALQAADGKIGLFTETRDKLNAYCAAVNSTVGQSGKTVYDVYGELLKINRRRAGERLPQFNLPELAAWNANDYQRRRAIVGEMQSRLGAIGSLRDHPFRGSRLKTLMPSEQENLEELCLVASQAVARLSARAERLAHLLRLAAPQTRGEAEVLARAARRAMTAPTLKGIQLRTGDWQARSDELRDLLNAGALLASLHAQFDAILIPEAWEQDLLATRQAFINYGHKCWRFLSGDYRRARNRLAGLCRSQTPREIKQQIQLVDAVMAARRSQTIVREHQQLGAALFGAQWQGEKSDWAVLRQLFDWIIALYRDIGDGQLPEGILTFLSGDAATQEFAPAIEEVETALEVHRRHTRNLVDALKLDESHRFGPGMKLEDRWLEEQEQLFDEWSASLPTLHDITSYNVQAETFEREGLAALLLVIDGWPAAAEHLLNAFEQNRHEALLKQAGSERPVLAGFNGESQNQAVQLFRRLDRQMTDHNRALLADVHWQNLPRQNGGGQLSVLRRELEKKSRHLPIRKLMAEAGKAVQAVKPVFMMSPLSIANYLAPGCVNFDLVIFDEASQVKPVDAFGALLRAKKAVVVGDSKQMPPTSFFDSLIQGSDDGDDEAENQSVTADIESILGLCKAQGMPERMLRWHYRSRHESLISVSNYEFYDNRLIVFPSSDSQSQDCGLFHRHLPHTIYDRGSSRTNPQEATTVAEAVMDFARAQLRLPENDRQSLLVAAFSVAQAKAVSDQLELLRRQDKSCEEFFDRGRLERFDVKNLESVQGDERDVIFISIGYGRDANGRVPMNFGPLNRIGGERRLNVLITRARRRCEVFTNLTDEDIDLARTNARGVQALKTFLAYARTGKLEIPIETGRGTDSPFEDEVKAALQSAGYEIRTQVGAAGFFIDLAVVNPQRRGSYLLGIECDGAMYHSSRAARDRDRLRQQVLEGLGWRIHRIWSTDWFRQPERELKRAIAAIEEAKTIVRPIPPARFAESSHAPIERVVTEPVPQATASRLAQPYQMANFPINLQGHELHTVRQDLLASWVAEIVKVESPIHISETLRRIATAAGLSRVGSRIKTAIEAACQHAIRTGTIRQQGEFLWTKEMACPLIRDRSLLPAASRKIELVAPEELALAIEQTIRNSFGIQRDSVAVEVIRILGFPRTGDEMRDTIERLMDLMLSGGKLKQSGSHIVISSAA